MAKSRYWLLVENNPSVEPVFDPEWMQYMVFQGEMGESGTPHWQIYVQCKIAQRASRLKAWIPSAHIDLQCGTNEQARDYSMKDISYKEGHQSVCLQEPKEFGEFKPTRGAQGTRNDLEALIDAVRECPSKKMKMVDEEFPVQAARYGKWAERVVRRSYYEDSYDEWRNVEIQVYWGPTGTGKTRDAKIWLKELGEYFMVTKDATTLWWDDYDGQVCLLLDEYDNWVNMTHLLRILYSDQCRLPVKGGHMYARWKRVAITSNLHPDEWHPNAKKTHRLALNRRLNKIIDYNLPTNAGVDPLDHNFYNRDVVVLDSEGEEEHKENI